MNDNPKRGCTAYARLERKRDLRDPLSKPTTPVGEWRSYGSMMPACLLGMMLVATHNYTIGVMLEPLQQAFGWTRAQISSGPLLTSMATVILAPFGGRAVDKHGPRKIALIGVPFFACALALIGTAGPSIASWLAVYALLAAALIFIYPSVWTSAIASRFDKSRGLALAVALSGTGLTAALVPLVASHFLEAYGWRSAYFGLGAIAFVIGFPLVFFTFDRHDRHDTLPIRRGGASKAGSLAEFRSGKFARLTAAAFVYSMCATTLGINAVPILTEKGFATLQAAEIVGLLGIGTILGRFGGGILLDRIDGRFVAVGAGIGGFLSATIFVSIGADQWLASLACFLLGIAAGAELDACAYLTTRHFKRSNFGALFGFIGGISGFAAGISPIVANLVYDRVQSYDPVLWAVLPLMVIASGLFLSLGKYPDISSK